MKKVTSFSMGMTSAYLAQLMKKRFGDVDSVLMDTSAEHPKSYKFAGEVIDYFDLNTTIIRLVTSDELGKGNTYEILSSAKELSFDMVAFNRSMAKYGVPYIGGMIVTGKHFT